MSLILAKCDCDDPDASNNDEEEAYCIYDTPTGGSLETSYVYPTYNPTSVPYYNSGVASAYGVPTNYISSSTSTYTSINGVSSSSSSYHSYNGRRLLQDGATIVVYKIHTDGEPSLKTLSDIANSPNNVIDLAKLNFVNDFPSLCHSCPPPSDAILCFSEKYNPFLKISHT